MLDDFLIFSKDISETNDLKQKLAVNFQLKDLGTAKQILGLNICVNQSKNIITLDQKDYIDSLLLKFNMEECKTIETPMEKNLKLEGVKNSNFSAPYQQLIGG